MSFENLSATWTDRPLTDPDIAADAVDLMVSHGDRRRGTFTVLICDPDNHYRATVTIDLPPNFTPTSAPDPSASATSASDPTPFAASAISTPGPASATPAPAASGTSASDPSATPASATSASATSNPFANPAPAARPFQNRAAAADPLASPAFAADPVPSAESRLSPAQLCETALDPIIPAVHTAPGTALVLALGRPGPARLTDVDHQWAQAAHAICEAAGIRLLGFYVATKEGVYQPAPNPTAAAA